MLNTQGPGQKETEALDENEIDEFDFDGIPYSMDGGGIRYSDSGEYNYTYADRDDDFEP
jgi:hypothetical protein